jgi:hypothetical protein
VAGAAAGGPDGAPTAGAGDCAGDAAAAGAASSVVAAFGSAGMLRGVRDGGGSGGSGTAGGRDGCGRSARCARCAERRLAALERRERALAGLRALGWEDALRALRCHLIARTANDCGVMVTLARVAGRDAEAAMAERGGVGTACDAASGLCFRYKVTRRASAEARALRAHVRGAGAGFQAGKALAKPEARALCAFYPQLASLGSLHASGQRSLLWQAFPSLSTACVGRRVGVSRGHRHHWHQQDLVGPLWHAA